MISQEIPGPQHQFDDDHGLVDFGPDWNSEKEDNVTETVVEILDVWRRPHVEQRDRSHQEKDDHPQIVTDL